ncbi:WD40-repeat-containing domain protein [Pavlovales sp. CCMP2436]|nr:WD40-repeat-containing domain protein [Pavlovales sp. CCMP2436]
MSRDLLFYSGRKQSVVRWLPFEGYGKRFVAVTGSWDDEDGCSTLAAWSFDSGSSPTQAMGEGSHSGGVTGIALGASSTTSVQVVTSSDRGCVAAFKLSLSADGERVEILPQWSNPAAHAGGATASVVTFPQDSAVAASAGEDGRLVVMSALSGQPLRAIRAAEDTVSCLAATGACTLASGGRSAVLWDLRDLHSTSQLTLGDADGAGNFTAVAFDPTGTLVAAGSSCSRLSIWDVRKGNTTLCNVQVPHKTTPIWELAFPPTAARSMLLSVSADGRLLQWDFASSVYTADNFQASQLNAVRVLADRTLSANSLDPHPTENQVVVVSDDDSIQLASYQV